MKKKLFFTLMVLCFIIVVIVPSSILAFFRKQIKKRKVKIHNMEKAVKIQKKMSELAGQKIFYDIKNKTYTDENGKDIPEFSGLVPEGIPPQSSDGIVPVFIYKTKQKRSRS